MWASHMPYYSEYHAGRSERDANPHALSKPTFPIISRDVPNDMNNSNNNSTGDLVLPQQSPRNMSELLEPAIDGPPSPERIRQLNAQMKRASHLNRGYGHRAASSSASSLLVTERAVWEQTMDNMPLSRRSSNRSAASRSPSQDRPDSVQVMGKNIFHRRAKSSKSGRSKRESSAHSSSGSSLYSTETPSESSLANLKEAFMPTIFARRKTSRDETAIQRKIQISGPFNFQHVTHTPRDQLANLQRGNRQELMAELSTLRVSGPTSAPGAIKGSDGQDAYFPNFSSENVGGQDAAIPRPPPVPRQSALVSGTRRLMKHARSQEQLRTSPPRPPVRPLRSPIEQIASPAFGPVPPPRVSSRQSMHRNGSPTSDLDRPQTSGGFRRPQPFSPEESPDELPTTSHGYMPEPDFMPVDETRFSHALTTPDDAAWPLATPGGTSYESPLADVPEEEEHFVFTHRPRASLASNTSSLRASQSVPALRTMSHRMSGASDTLGPLETSITHRATRSGQLDGSGSVSPIRESWEDDIDYCYEHEADANFNYEWERPSLDVGRENTAPPVQVALALVDDELSEAPSTNTAHSSPGMLSASRHEVPALSPASQASPFVGHEATTPLSTTAVKNNFSLPRGERVSRPPNLNHIRSDSRASSFKECHGFTLSPSLLIPGDYHHQMLLTEAEKLEYPNDDEFRNKFFKSNAFYEDSLEVANQASPFMLQQRASVSTTATNSTTISDSTGERHVSTNSTWTTLTRLTSSTSLNKMAGSWSETTGDRVPGTHLADPQEDSDQEVEESTPPASQDKDTVPELTPFPSVPVGKRSFHKSHASESIVRDEVPPMKSPEPTKTRRPRARTTSMSAQAPPVGQYALFPRSYIKGNGDRI